MEHNGIEFMIEKQRLNDFLTTANDDQKDVLMLKHVFTFIEQNLEKLDEKIQMSDVLQILHYSLQLEVQKGNELHVGSFVQKLLNFELRNEDSDKHLQRTLQILYQILNTLSPEDTKTLQIGNDVFLQLIEILLSNRSAKNIANILSCLKIHLNKFKNNEILEQLGNTIRNSLNSNEITENTAHLQTLIYFFDEFCQHESDFRTSKELNQFIETLLNTDHHDNRKIAYFFLKKVHLFVEGPIKEGRNNFWNILISNFENLEENQSHLILPTLDQLKKFNISNCTELFWLDILYRQILRHKNILVRRWILEYMLENLTFYSLSSETQLQFMQSLNDTSLYNVEGYMLASKDIGRFLNCDKSKSNFLLTFSQIEWKAVPLHFWLTHLNSNSNIMNEADITQKTLLDLAIKIRALQNVSMRRENIKTFEKVFSKIIEDMEFVKYVQLVKTLYNVSDPYENENKAMFYKKLQNCKERDLEGNRIFTLQFYNIITNDFPSNLHDDLNFNSSIEEKIEQYNWQPGFLRFILIFNSHRSDSTRKFCQKHYGISTSWLETQEPLHQLYEKFFKVFANTKEEEYFIKQKVTDDYVQHRISKYNEITDYNYKVEDLLNAGSYRTLYYLSHALASHTPFVGKEVFTCFLESLRNHLKNDKLSSNVCRNLMKHCRCNLDRTEVGHYAQMILDLDMNNFILFDSVTKNLNEALFPIEFLIKNALLADTKVGDSRIEEAYECMKLARQAKLHLIRMGYIKLLSSLTDEHEKRNSLKILYEKIKNINGKRPRYYANSKEHRSMIHILSIILYILPKVKIDSEDSSEMWTFLIEHNNQQNVTILYEIAIANIMNWNELFFKAEKQLKVTTCTSSHELCMIAVLYRCYKLKCNFEKIAELERLIDLLWPLTMGANFQTRLHAQLTISRLIDEYQTEKSLSDVYIKLGANIKKILAGEQLSKFNKDVRFMKINIEDSFEEVMNFTNSPYDEYNFLYYKRFRFQTEPLTYGVERAITEKQTIPLNCDVQRKLNPVADFIPPPNLYSCPQSKAKTLFVVASLIDKIPNLGGIARTVEVLGIKNLVIDSKAHTEKADFKNLSMTAENSLNIIEVKPSMLTDFILRKKTEGFQIIGAEQTAHSCSFVDFKFPQRSVLLLGHEKEGIPPNLLGFLDYAVEIPQFGMIRSLNVHVTGALFMWEYCKQHIINS